MQPIGPFGAVCSFGGVTPRAWPSRRCSAALFGCTVDVYGPASKTTELGTPQPQFSLLAACKTLARRLFGAILSPLAIRARERLALV